jgi:hypothetical protein
MDVPTLDICGDEANVERLERVLLKFNEACAWLESIISKLPSDLRTAEYAEQMVCGWLLQEDCAKLSLKTWRKILSAPPGMVRVTSDHQAPLPAESRKTLETWVQHVEMREDKVVAALEWLNHVAHWANISRSTVSFEMMLEKTSSKPTDCECSKELDPTCIKHLDMSVRIKHLNALMEFLAGLLDKRPEKSLAAAYRVELPDLREYTTRLRELSQSHRDTLLQLLVRFTIYIVNNPVGVDWRLPDCLENVLDDETDESDISAALQPVANLAAKHIFYALDTLRSFQTSNWQVA